MLMMAAWRRNLSFVAVIGLLTACSSSTAATPSPTPDLGAEYLRIVASGNASIDQLNTAVSTQPLDGAKIRAAAKPVYDSSIKLNTDLLAFEKKVPVTVQSHVEAARTALSKEIADLQQVIASADDASLITTVNIYYADAQASTSAFVLLRSDLGLPPPTLNSPSPTPSA